MTLLKRFFLIFISDPNIGTSEKTKMLIRKIKIVKIIEVEKIPMEKILLASSLLLDLPSIKVIDFEIPKSRKAMFPENIVARAIIP